MHTLSTRKFPRSRELFHFFKPETLADWVDQSGQGSDTLRKRLLQDMPVLDAQDLRECQIKAITVQDGELDLASLKYLPADHDEFPLLLLQDGDLLFNRTNSPELVGKTAVFRSQVVPCSFASYLISVRFSESYTPEFAAAFINSLYGKYWIKPRKRR